ncbi:helix-turn-helix domain-containing protein [Lactococcus garvieae]|uniref:helix-turn-helix domain-containing protein n=1 Tax=Lactococcus garvieae TaxID=1363 RepID=UPI0022E1F1B5|nr:Rgg/GadR/MutR family transcriptional regulator [Lactococcus garvieae]
MVEIDPRYGSVFRRLRKKRGYSLSFFYQLGFSKSTLGSFERGESMMGFDRVLMCLYEMDIPLSEFEQLLNNYSIGYQEDMIIEIEKADLHHDKVRIMKIERELNEMEYPLLALAAKSRYKRLSQEELGDIISYLFESDNWGYFELTLIYFTIEQFRTKDMDSILTDFIDASPKILKNPQYRDRFIQISYRAIALLCERGDKTRADYFLKYTEKYVREHTLFLNNIRYFVQGLYVRCFIDKSKGVKQMKDSLSIFRTLEAASIARYYENYYQKYLQE